ncbi:MAG TPA: carbamoyltransferase N-terminal domain-containing protein, partial [Longimicrobium sp.]
MYILGINAFHGDVSAVLLNDGELVGAVEEERFRRVKHWAGFPTQSIHKVLEMGGITGHQVDHVAVSRNPRANLVRKGLFALGNRPSAALLRDRMSNARRVLDLKAPLAEALGVDRLPRVHYVEHHPSHLASTFFVSPFDD